MADVAGAPENVKGSNSTGRAIAWLYAAVVLLCTTLSALYYIFVTHDIKNAPGEMFRIYGFYTATCVLLTLLGLGVRSSPLKWVGITFGSIGFGAVIASLIFLA